MVGSGIVGGAHAHTANQPTNQPQHPRPHRFKATVDGAHPEPTHTQPTHTQPTHTQPTHAYHAQRLGVVALGPGGGAGKLGRHPVVGEEGGNEAAALGLVKGGVRQRPQAVRQADRLDVRTRDERESG